MVKVLQLWEEDRRHRHYAAVDKQLMRSELILPTFSRHCVCGLWTTTLSCANMNKRKIKDGDGTSF
jgi:hypothetical protein